MRKRIVIWLLAVTMSMGPVIVPERAAAGGLPFATEFTQLLNYATLIHQYAQ